LIETSCLTAGFKICKKNYNIWNFSKFVKTHFLHMTIIDLLDIIEFASSLHFILDIFTIRKIRRLVLWTRSKSSLLCSHYQASVVVVAAAAAAAAAAADTGNAMLFTRYSADNHASQSAMIM